MKSNTLLLLTCIFYLGANAQTKELSFESAGLTNKKQLLQQTEDFGIPSSSKVIDTVKVLNDSTYVESYYWTYSRWHNGLPVGKDTIIFRSPSSNYNLYIYSEAFLKDFNSFNYESNPVAIYPKKSEKLQKRANEVNYTVEKHTFVFTKKGNASLLLVLILLFGSFGTFLNWKKDKS
jgi:hypothetical protein